MRTRMNRTGLSYLAVALAGVCLHVETAAGQGTQPRPEPPRSERSFCWQGRPVESCRSFLLAEGGAHMLLAGSRYRRVGDRYDYDTPGVTRSPHLTGHVNLEVGIMVNRGPAHAVGATVLGGGDANGFRLGAKGRYRRWMGRDAALDLGAGVLVAQQSVPFQGADVNKPGNLHVVVAGLTGDAALGLTDWVSLSVRGDLMLDADGSPSHGVYGGLRLGTRPAAVATVAPFVLALGLLLVVGGGG